ncbi:MAG: calcineurin-like phosphoesterase family protein [Pseudomonadota bacterium]
MLALITAGALAGAPYIATPEVTPGRGDDTVWGYVFHDMDRDGRRGRGEDGVPGVKVSNGLDVVLTDALGRYELDVRDDMNLTVVQPSGWRVPTDERLVPQFFHVHKRGGTPEALRYGGLPDAGPAPSRVNFPLMPATGGEHFTCAVVGDSQTYSNAEVSHFRDSAVADLVNADLGAGDCLLYVGDVMGDDLNLLNRLLQVGAKAGAPQWLVHGNHDFDFDASSDAHSADSWRRLYGPNYYAFEIGETLFIALDNVVFPCGQEDYERYGRSFCVESDWARYNGRVTDEQMHWLANLLEHTPQDRLIVLAHHIPFVSFVDAATAAHQTDNLADIFELLEGRPALSLSGHTHTIENHAPGQSFEGWNTQTGIDALAFRHIIAGAASGGWWQGDFAWDGDPMALQRMGAPKGVLMLDFEGGEYTERYVGSRIDPARGQWVDFNTPSFRSWYDALTEWRALDPQTRDPVPPVGINDLPDTRILTPDELAGGVYLTANVWVGSAETRVQARINDSAPFALERTQDGAGEAARIGAQWADPFATQRQLSVGRFSIESRSGDANAQGFQAFQGRQYGPAPAQPGRVLADRNMHLWRARLPADLPEGAHLMEVTSTDRNGQVYTDRIVFEVRSERPQPTWDGSLWD